MKGNLDRDHFSEIHRRLFQDVSTHAGQVRGYDLNKGDTEFADQRTMDYIFETELPKRLVDNGITAEQIRDVKEQITQNNGHDYSR